MDRNQPITTYMTSWIRWRKSVFSERSVRVSDGGRKRKRWLYWRSHVIAKHSNGRDEIVGKWQNNSFCLTNMSLCVICYVSNRNTLSGETFCILEKCLPSIFELFWNNSSYVSGLSVFISLALWLCVFGFLLQEAVRLKVLWVDA